MEPNQRKILQENNHANSMQEILIRAKAKRKTIIWKVEHGTKSKRDTSREQRCTTAKESA